MWTHLLELVSIVFLSRMRLASLGLGRLEGVQGLDLIDMVCRRMQEAPMDLGIGLLALVCL